MKAECLFQTDLCVCSRFKNSLAKSDCIFQTLILIADLSFLGSYAVLFGEPLATFQRIPAPEKYR
jgi:hypothetical protein